VVRAGVSVGLGGFMRLWFGRCEGGGEEYKQDGRREGESRRGKERVRSGMDGERDGRSEADGGWRIAAGTRQRGDGDGDAMML
jgi:hypothetical protein